MARFVESVKSAGILSIDRTLLGIFFVFVFLPLIFFLGQNLFEFSPSGFSSLFLWVALRSLLFSALQAALSAVSVGALATLIAWALLSFGEKLPASFIKILWSLGFVIFIFPSTALVLGVFDFLEATSLPSQGIFAIVLCHVFWNLFWISSQLFERMNAWAKTEGQDLLQYARTQIPSLHRQFYLVFAPLIRNELRHWLPLVFLWSFTAFSSVILLGGGPQQSNPEVLLYYTLFNDPESGRVLLLVFMQALSYGLLYKTIFKAHSSSRFQSGHKETLPGFVIRAPWWVSLSSLFFICFFLGPVFRLVFHLFQTQWSGSSLIWMALANSLLLSLFCGLMTWVLATLLALSSDSIRKYASWMLALSGTLLVGAWIYLRLDIWVRDSAFLSLLSTAFFIALLQAPFISLWIDNRLKKIPGSSWESLACMGARPQDQVLFRRVLLRDLLLYSAALSAASSFGELAISSLLASEIPLLSTLGRQMAQRYDFESSGFVLWVSTLYTVIIAQIALRLRSRRFL